MTEPTAAWFPDPSDQTRLRWWDGHQWSKMSVPLSEVGIAADASRSMASPSTVTVGQQSVPAPGTTTWHPTPLFWIVGSAILLCALIGLASGFGGFLVVLGIAGLVTGIVAAAAKRRTWLNLPAASGVRAGVIGLSALLFVIGVGVSPHSTSTQATSSNRQIESTQAARETHDPEPTHSETPTPTPTPTPVIAQLTNYASSTASSAQTSLQSQGVTVVLQPVSGQAAPTDWTGWTVSSESPAAGSALYAGSTVTLLLSPPPAPAPAPAAPAAPAPAQPAAPAAPVAPGGGATALCNDGSYSYAAHHQGACSHHGGVAQFYK